MKNSYVVGIFVVVLIGVVLFFGMKKQEVEAPLDTSNNGASGTVEEGTPVNEDTDLSVSTGMPVPGSDTEEMEVVKEFTVTGKNFSFSPSTLTVKKGDKVRITFVNSEGFHDWKIDAYGAATKQTKAPTTEVIEFVADKAGSFEYYCSVGKHRDMGMKGTLVVE